MSIPPMQPPDSPDASQTQAAPPQLMARRASGMRQLLLFLLNLCLLLFLADGLISLLDDSLVLFFNVSAVTPSRTVVAVLDCLLAFLVYGLMGLTPLIPKRFFLPVVLFTPVIQMVFLPVMIYSFNRISFVAWICSLCQVGGGLLVLYYARGAFEIRWSLINENRLGMRRFSWLNSLGFVLVNVFILLPALTAYFVVCAALAVGHFTDGFVSLSPEGLKVQARKYVRDDGKTIQLIPMAHVGDAGFYRQLTESFPTNSVILMEGVTDNRNLLTNHISYKRMAKSLGLTEQKMEFKPNHGKSVMADVDVEQFTKSTIDFMNVVMLFHAKGVNAQTLPMLLQYTPPANIQDQVFEDILFKRNQHLLEEIQAQLKKSATLVVPWGAAHMPGIAAGIQKAGFHVVETKEYLIIRFGTSRSQSPSKTGG